MRVRCALLLKVLADGYEWKEDELRVLALSAYCTVSAEQQYCALFPLRTVRTHAVGANTRSLFTLEAPAHMAMLVPVTTG